MNVGSVIRLFKFNHNYLILLSFKCLLLDGLILLLALLLLPVLNKSIHFLAPWLTHSKYSVGGVKGRL